MTFRSFSKCCPPSTPNQNGYTPACDFTQYVDFDYRSDIHPKSSSINQTIVECGQLAVKWGQDAVWLSGNYPYDTYQDCYAIPGDTAVNPSDADYAHYEYPEARSSTAQRRWRRAVTSSNDMELMNNYPTFIDEAVSFRLLPPFTPVFFSETRDTRFHRSVPRGNLQLVEAG